MSKSIRLLVSVSHRCVSESTLECVVGRVADLNPHAALLSLVIDGEPPRQYVSQHGDEVSRSPVCLARGGEYQQWAAMRGRPRSAS
jgi:hypothetical protein